jgi:hypothetical protein
MIKCMDASGCQAQFTAEEIARFVNTKTLALRDKLESGDAIREVLLRVPINLGLDTGIRVLSVL